VARFQFRCSECGARYREDELRYVCPRCARLQGPGREVRGILEVELDEPPRAWPEGDLASPAFLEAFLPIASRDSLPPLPTGGTPLLEAHRLRAELGMPRLWLKDDTRNPSGSTKDRASQLVVAKAREYGLATIATASTGNAASALAAAAAAAGLQAVVFVPAAAPQAKLVQMLAYGARVVRVAGSYDQAFELCCVACDRFGWYNRNTALNPFTVEGKKTAALEIGRQLAGDPPDVMVVPSGDGVIISGVAKGFADLVDAGLLARAPRLLAVQPAGSNALVRALATGAETVQPLPGAVSVADSLVVEAPRAGRLALRRIRATGGNGVAVDDEAIVAAIGRLAASTGVFAEPAAAAALAGLEAALEVGLVDRDERVVLLITGSGLKDVPSAARAVAFPEPVEPDLEAIASALATAEDRRRQTILRKRSARRPIPRSR
jgi:threonine synthase